MYEKWSVFGCNAGRYDDEIEERRKEKKTKFN